MANACRYCNAPIAWVVGPNGKSKPVNPDGSDHRCQAAQATQPPAQYGQPTQVFNPPQAAPVNDKETKIARQSSLKVAADVVLGRKGQEDKPSDIIGEDIIALARLFTAFVQEG